MSTNYQTEKLVPYDIEVFRNFFLVGFYLPPKFISIGCETGKETRYTCKLLESQQATPHPIFPPGTPSPPGTGSSHSTALISRLRR